MRTTLGRVSTAGARAMTLEAHRVGQKCNKNHSPGLGKINPGCIHIQEQFSSTWIHLFAKLQIVTIKRDERTHVCYVIVIP